MRSKFKYRGALLGRVKHDLPKLTSLKIPRFRPKKLTFTVAKKAPFALKGSYVETFLNSWKKTHLLAKEASFFYGLNKKQQARHRLTNLQKSKRSIFGQSESTLAVIITRCG